MSDIEEYYFGHENVLVFSNLDDIGQPYTCEDWGDRGVQFGAMPLITDDGPGSDLWGKFNTGGYFPSVAWIDHTMTVHHKQSGGPTFAFTKGVIDDMLDKLYSSLLLSANFEIDFNGDSDGDGLINPGDSFDVFISVMNKSYSDDNTAQNVNLELTSDCDDVVITSSNLGEIGNISAGDSYQVEATISVNQSVIIDDYFLDLVISTDNMGDDGQLVTEQFSADFSVTLNQSGFPADVSGELISSAAIIDLDNDGVDEIVSSDKGGFIHVFEMDGSEWVNDQFPFETGDQNWGSPAVGNLNGSTGVVISSKNGQIYYTDSSENSIIGSIFNSGGFVTATPALGDIDGDGFDEIIFGQYGGSERIYAINLDGSNVNGFPYDLDQKVQRGVALSDFNNNDKVDIVVGTDDEFIHLIYDDGSLGWSYETGGDIRVAPTVLELNTGEKIILAGSKDDNFYGLNSDGSLRFMIETDDDISTEASVIDIDGTGSIIFFASGDHVYAVQSNGQAYGNWPMDVGSDVISSITFSLIDGQLIAMFGDDSGQAHAYTLNGDAYNNFPISYDFPFKGSPTILDTDGDGDLEFIVGSTQTLTSIDIKESGDNTNFWNTHRANMKRNGHYVEGELMGSHDNSQIEFSIVNAYPNPFNPSVRVDYFIDASDFVEISIISLEGKIIETIESSFKNQGMHSITWTPGNIASGVYLLNISTSSKLDTQKLMFLK